MSLLGAGPRTSIHDESTSDFLIASLGEHTTQCFWQGEYGGTIQTFSDEHNRLAADTTLNTKSGRSSDAGLPSTPSYPGMAVSDQSAFGILVPQKSKEWMKLGYPAVTCLDLPCLPPSSGMYVPCIPSTTVCLLHCNVSVLLCLLTGFDISPLSSRSA